MSVTAPVAFYVSICAARREPYGMAARMALAMSSMELFLSAAFFVLTLI